LQERGNGGVSVRSWGYGADARVTLPPAETDVPGPAFGGLARAGQRWFPVARARRQRRTAPVFTRLRADQGRHENRGRPARLDRLVVRWRRSRSWDAPRPCEAGRDRLIPPTTERLPTVALSVPVTFRTTPNTLTVRRKPRPPARATVRIPIRLPRRSQSAIGSCPQLHPQ